MKKETIPATDADMFLSMTENNRKDIEEQVRTQYGERGIDVFKAFLSLVSIEREITELLDYYSQTEDDDVRDKLREKISSNIESSREARRGVLSTGNRQSIVVLYQKFKDGIPLRCGYMFSRYDFLHKKEPRPGRVEVLDLSSIVILSDSTPS